MVSVCGTVSCVFEIYLTKKCDGVKLCPFVILTIAAFFKKSFVNFCVTVGCEENSKPDFYSLK